jgi:putative ABC transport system ATP-binding protein
VSPGDDLIRLDGVSRVYRVGDSEVRALDDVSLALRPGEFVALMGPSGSGKSTLLNVVGCLDSPTSGIYRFEGEPVQGLSDDRLAAIRQNRIGFIFQSYHLVPRMTAARNVELPLLLAGVEPGERRERVRAALRSVDIERRARHRPDEMSGGERQRVAIARAVVMRPSLLLADEPTGNLDSRTGAEIVALLERLNAEGLTILLVTHDAGVAAHAHRLVRMRDGRIHDDAAAGGEGAGGAPRAPAGAPSAPAPGSAP